MASGDEIDASARADRWAKPLLIGQLVALRALDEGDTDAVWEAVNDPEGNDLTHTTATFAYEQVRAWCASRPAAAERVDLAVVEKATGEVAGEAVLNEFDPDQNSVNFRIALRGPAWYGRGLGTEATRLLIGHALGPMGLDTITLTVLARNERARRAYERVGFRETGTFDDDGERWVAMAITTGDPIG